MPHLKRAEVSPHHPVHVTQRIQPGVGYLRSQSRARLIRDAFREVRLRFGLRVVHYSIQGNHLHLIVEADSAAALAHGMQALSIRIAKGLNALAGRRGGVFVDRYHAHALATRREVANAVRYVLGNYRHHAREAPPPVVEGPLLVCAGSARRASANLALAHRVEAGTARAARPRIRTLSC